MAEHEDHHLRFVVRTQVVQQKEVWKNREDSQGGPGYYPFDVVIFEDEFMTLDVKTEIKRLVRLLMERNGKYVQ